MKTSSFANERASSEDLEKLLALAENMQERCERWDRKIQTLRLGQILMLALFIVVFAYLIVGGPMWGDRLDTPLSASVVLISTAIATLLNIVALEWTVRMTRRRSFPDKTALHRLLDLIRETESATAKSQGWSALERAQFQIRLSRLAIEP